MRGVEVLMRRKAELRLLGVRIFSQISVEAQNLPKALGQLRSVTLLRADFAIRFRSAGSLTSDRIARVKSSMSCDLVIKPFVPLATNSFGPPESETTTGSPEACASRMTLPNVSVVLEIGRAHV